MATKRRLDPTRTPAPAAVDAAESGAHTHWIFAALTAAAILGIVIFLPIEWVFDVNSPDFNPMELLILFLGAVGSYHLFHAVRETARARKFGTATLSLTGAAVTRLGGTLEGVVRTPARLEPTGDVRVVLQCVDVYVFRSTSSSSDSSNQRRESVVWEATVQVPARGLDSVLGGIPFAFRLPASVGDPPTPAEPGSEPAAAPYFRFQAVVNIPFMKRVWAHHVRPAGRGWRLVVSAPTRGTNFLADFAVRVEDR